jgi:hypothetical protein
MCLPKISVESLIKLGVELASEYTQMIIKGNNQLFIKYGVDEKFSKIKCSDIETVCKASNKEYSHWKACAIQE